MSDERDDGWTRSICRMLLCTALIAWCTMMLAGRATIVETLYGMEETWQRASIPRPKLAGELIRNCPPLLADSHVILSMTVQEKFKTLLPLVVFRWRCAGFYPHVVIVRSNEDNQTTVSDITRYLDYAKSIDLFSFELVNATNYTRLGIAGISRYAAASTNRFLDKFVVISDMDLVPGGTGELYYRSLRENVPGDSDKVHFDLQYQKYKVCHTLTTFSSYHLRETCTRSPRFRSSYSHGFGRAYQRAIPLLKGEPFDNTRSVLKRLFQKDMVRFAYTGWWETMKNSNKTESALLNSTIEGYLANGPDNAFDEILFGKLLTGYAECKGFPSNMNCVKVVTERVDKQLGLGMIYEGSNRLFVKAGMGTVKLAMGLRASLDVHISRKQWLNGSMPAALKPVVQIFQNDCCRACGSLDCDQVCGATCNYDSV